MLAEKKSGQIQELLALNGGGIQESFLPIEIEM
jgi:hypothetical protein